MTGAKCMNTDTMHCIYCVYFDADRFIETYLNCVAYVVHGGAIEEASEG
jgi:hypothetical protein